MDPLDAAYLAGIIDGEGSIFAFLRHGVIAPRLTVSNTDRSLLSWIMETTGVGHIFQHRKDEGSHKASYSWRSHAEGAETVIEQIQRFLKIKTRQAELALAIQKRLRDPALKADRSWQSEWHLRMKALNRRGPVET